MRSKRPWAKDRLHLYRVYVERKSSMMLVVDASNMQEAESLARFIAYNNTQDFAPARFRASAKSIMMDDKSWKRLRSRMGGRFGRIGKGKFHGRFPWG